MNPFSPIMDVLKSIVSTISDAVLWVLNSFFELIWGILYLVVDGLLTVVTGFVSLLDLSNIITNLTASWGLLPPQIVWIIDKCGFAQALAIVGYAYLVRMILNLIPATFTRL